MRPNNDIKKTNIFKKIFKSTLIKKGGVATLDQIFLSATNFLITILLIKYLTKADYGYYSIAYSIALYLVSIQNALINTPLNVLYAGIRKEEQKNYVSSLLWSFLLVLIPVTLLIIIVSPILNKIGIEKQIINMCIALSISAIGILIREYARSYLYTIHRETSVLLLDIIFIVSYILCIFLIIWLGSLSILFVFISMGFASLFASLIYLGPIVKKFNLKSITSSFIQNWEFGKWALLGATTSHARAYGSTYILSLISNIEAVADLNASRLLMMPFAQIILGWERIIKPHGSQMREDNRLKYFYKEMILSALLISVGLIVYSSTLYVFFDSFIDILFKAEYQGLAKYLPFYTIIFMLRIASKNASNGLQVIKQFKSESTVSLFTMIITLTSSYYFVKLLQIKGALISNIIGELFFAILVWHIFTKQIIK